MARTQDFHCQGPGSIPGQETKTLQALQCDKIFFLIKNK